LRKCPIALLCQTDMVLKLADNRDPNSLASRLRARRNEWFRSLISNLPKPLTVLDVGGMEAVWETIGFVNRPDIQITLLNVEPCKTSYSNISVVIGDARNMHQFRDNQFDVVYSNSVIEHVGALDDMRRMAQEIRRVGKRYFLQTPNRYFPIEPHFVFPFFQFLPRSVQIFLLQNYKLGWIGRVPERKFAEIAIDSIRLLTWNEMRSLFADAEIEREKLFGITKSLIAYKM
jgi:ubiquinone/menaquinone biosynthesis C-methylase UbiE